MVRISNEKLFEESKTVLVGGVNSPVRAFKVVGGAPRFIARGQGSKIYDVEGKEYIDYVLSWGPLILGHAHPAVVRAAKEAIEKGSSFGAPTEAELKLARLVQEFYPSIEKIRFVSSGTEACMGAIRAARGFTRRDKIVKFEGCYHGHADYLLVKAGSGASTLGEPDSAGVPKSFTQHTIVVPLNDPAAVKQAFKRHGKNIAAVIIEPVVGNIGVVLPDPEFLPFLREITRQHDSLLIFDEVLCGFRIPDGGVQARFQVQPDLTCLGKVIGGGFPVGAFGGRAEIMAEVSPEGPVYQAGTLSGNPVAMAAGLATLEELKSPSTQQALHDRTLQLVQGMDANLEAAGITAQALSIGSMFSLFFTKKVPRNYTDVKTQNTERFKIYFHAMLERGVYLAPSGYEAGFVSSAHTAEDIEKTLSAQREAFAKIKK
jgi:glutamate-1-semialdehyde 2,1-aminomutase